MTELGSDIPYERTGRGEWPFLTEVAYIVVIVILYLILNLAFFGIIKLPASVYFQSIITGQLWRYPIIFLFLLGMAVPVLGYNQLRWTQFENGRSLRLTIFFIALILAWAFATYDYNHFYNQAHYFDRFLLLLFAAFILLHPIFVPFFVFFALIIARQFEFPLGSYSWTDKQVLFDILILFSTLLYVKLLDERVDRYFILLALCLFTANYITSALRKLTLNWLVHNDLANLIVASFANGWFPSLPEKTVLQMAQLIHKLSPVLLFLTLIIEFSPIFTFFHHRLAIFILFGTMGLHTIIFLSSGIFFWKWMALALIFIVYLSRLEGEQITAVFNKKHATLSLILFLLAPIFFRPVYLGWYDTPLNNFYRLEAIGESGTVYEIGRNFMSPYDPIFAQNRFWYLNNTPLVVGTYGATNILLIANHLEQIDSLAALLALEDEYGQNYYDVAQGKQFEEFIKSYFAHLNENGRKTIPLNYLAAPQHIWSFARENSYQMQEPIKTIQVRLVKTLYHRDQIQTLSDEMIRQIEIP